MAKRTLALTAGALAFAVGALLSLPFLPVGVWAWARGAGFPPLPLALIGLGIPLVAGVPLLRRGAAWLSERRALIARIELALGGLWALAGPLAALNSSRVRLPISPASEKPLALLVIGLLPPLLGLLYMAEGRRLWPAGPLRTRAQQKAGWVYLGVALLQVVPGIVEVTAGEPVRLLYWLTQAASTGLLAAALLERPVQGMGAFFVSLGLSMALLFLPTTEPGQVSTLVLNPARTSDVWPVQPVSFPTGATVALVVMVTLALGLWQSLREHRRMRQWFGAGLGLPVLLFLIPLALSYGIGSAAFLLIVFLLTLAMAGWQILRQPRETNSVLGAILFLFILAFLLWAGRGKEFNFTGMLISMVGAATPIALGALSGVWCERSAVINIAIEGMMLSAAFTGVVASSATKSLLLGLLVAVLTGGLLAALLAVLSIRFKVDQIIAGTAINIFAVGATSFLGARLLVQRQDLNASANFGPASLPLLSRIPVIGPVLFQNNLIIYLMLLLVVVTHVVLFYTRWGLRSRAVGEHPQAADTLGVNVFRTRYINVIIGGLIAGLGGAYFTLGSVGRFDEVMTAGRGFIGLAAMIFGRWNPFGAFASSLIFGFADSLQVKLSILKVPIPSHFLLMAPYLATIVVLAGVVGRAEPPAADGQPYEKD